MVLILGGPSGGDFVALGPLPDIIEDRLKATCDVVNAGITSSCCRALAKVVTGDTMLLQHECEDGITEAPHMCAIFWQQWCSSAVMLRPFIMHAASGWPESTTASTAATIGVARFNICNSTSSGNRPPSR
jgi:hypothetical protein